MTFEKFAAAGAVILSLSLLGGQPLAAQTADPAPDAPATDAPATDTPAEPTPDPNALSLGEEVAAGPTVYTKEEFGPWQLNCEEAFGDRPESCQLYQLLKDANGTSVAEISVVALPPGQDAVMGATIITPLETLLTENLTIAVDGAKAKRYPFTFCAAIGCIARVGFVAAEVDAFRKGSKATVSIVPVAAPDKKVSVDISLEKFTAGFEAVTAANAAPAP
jgi:invasion protein IalB